MKQEKKGEEMGIYGPNGEFKSDIQIRRELALKGQIAPIIKDKYTAPSFSEYIQNAEDRKKTMQESSPVHQGKVDITLAETSTINFIGDVHFGNPNTDNRRIQQEVEAIKNTPNSFVVFMGDLVDGIFWGGTSHSEQNQTMGEQHGFLRSMFRELKGKILGGISGEHDSKWASKSGYDPYDILAEESGAPYVRGIGEFDIHVGDQDYQVVAQHKARGHSMYNKNHPTYRESRFHLQGADVYASAHTHQKQVSQEGVRSFGEAKEVTHVSVGTYKTRDEYGDRQGFPEQKPEEMYGAAIRLHKEKKKVDVDNDILNAVKRWSKE